MTLTAGRRKSIAALGGGAVVGPLAARLTDANRVPMTVALPVLLAVLALLLRLYGLSDKSLWYDEIVTLNRANLPFAELVIDSLKHKHYPTYFLLLSSFTSADIDEWMLRFPSALFGAICVFLVTRLATEIRGPQAGLVAGVLMALSPFEVQFGQEARSYTLISCLVLVAIWGLVRIAHAPVAAALPMSRPAALRGAWAAYALGTLGALFVHNNTVPWFLVSNVALLVVVHRAPSQRRGLLRNWAWTQAIILFLWLPGPHHDVASKPGGRAERGWMDTRSQLRKHLVGGLCTLSVSDIGYDDVRPAACAASGIRRGGCDACTVGSMAVESRSALAGSGWARLSGGADRGFGRVPVPADVGTTVFDVEHRSFFRISGHWGNRTAGEIFPPDCHGRCSRRRGKPCALLQLRNQAALGSSGGISARPQDVIVVQNQSVKFVLASHAKRFGLDSRIPILPWSPYDTAPRPAAGERVWVLYGRVGQGAQEPEEGFRQKWLAFGSPAEQARFGSHILIFRFDNSIVASEPVLADAE